MPLDLRIAEPIDLDRRYGETVPLIEVLDKIAWEQTLGDRSETAVVGKRRCRSCFAVPRLAELEADLQSLLEDLDEELRTLSSRLDRALSR